MVKTSYKRPNINQLFNRYEYPIERLLNIIFYCKLVDKMAFKRSNTPKSTLLNSLPTINKWVTKLTIVKLNTEK